MPTPRRPLPRVPLVAFLVALTLGSGILAGCTPRFVALYDAHTDEAVTALQRRTEEVLTRLERDLGTPMGSYEQFASAYAGLLIDTRAIRVRTAAKEQNGRQAEQLGEIEQQVRTVEGAHRGSILVPAMIGPIRNTFEQSFRAILALEFAKKRVG